MIDLTAESFHPVAQKVRCFACILYRGDWGDAERAIAALEEEQTGPEPVWTRLDLDDAPEVAANFGLAETAEPQLLLMKERVVLYLKPLASHDAAETAALLTRAAAVDMEAARRSISQSRSAQSHLFARRVCPTAHRGKD